MSSPSKRNKRIKPAALRSFKKLIYDYYGTQGRSLPWRETRNPYHILVSELMLQQTQVNRVIQKYQEFVAAFPEVITLANAPLRAILKVWQGLGYNRRALALQQIARALVAHHNGKVPSSLDDLIKLPGIGKATASAILAFAFNQPVVFIETNVRTVFIHCFFPERNGVSDEDILPLVSQTLDVTNPREWYYALMDYGTFLKKTVANAGRKSTHYHKQAPFDGSTRQLRGRILRYLIKERKGTEEELVKQLKAAAGTIRKTLHDLEKEGMIIRKGTMLTIA